MFLKSIIRDPESSNEMQLFKHKKHPLSPSKKQYKSEDGVRENYSPRIHDKLEIVSCLPI